jgi:hypothetical protein
MLGARDRRQREAERDLALAHTTAIFTRATKLQPLAHYLPRAPSDPRSMLGRLKAIAAATGGTIEGEAQHAEVSDTHGAEGRA